MLGHGIIRNSPLPIESPKTERPLPEILTEGEISRVLESSSETNRAYRDFAIIELLYGSGLRVSEATGIRMEDISFENETIRIKGKGNRERIAFLNRNSIEALRKYIQKRNEYAGSTDSGYLFINRSGKRLSRQSVWKMVKKINVTDKNVTPHTYRHSFATHLLQAGVDLRIVQELLGHKTLATTEIYTHVDKRQIQKVYRKFHPRA
jgi:integrase/recombinase XerD